MKGIWRATLRPLTCCICSKCCGAGLCSVMLSGSHFPLSKPGACALLFFLRPTELESQYVFMLHRRPVCSSCVPAGTQDDVAVDSRVKESNTNTCIEWYANDVGDMIPFYQHPDEVPVDRFTLEGLGFFFLVLIPINKSFFPFIVTTWVPGPTILSDHFANEYLTGSRAPGHTEIRAVLFPLFC